MNEYFVFHNKRSHWWCLLLLITLFFSVACEELRNALSYADIEVSVVGEVKVNGDMPMERKVVLYAPEDNRAAFDTSLCVVDGVEITGCSGRINIERLTTPIDQGMIRWEGDRFTISNVQLTADLGFIAVISGSGGASCSQDVVGFDEESKLVTLQSMITVDVDFDNLTETDFDEFTLPRPAQIRCETPAEEPTLPDDTEPREEPTPDTIDEDNGTIIGVGDGWSAFSISIDDITIDASQGNIGRDSNPIPCGAEGQIAPVLTLNATAEDASLTEAYIRIQVGRPESGETPVYLTDVVPLNNGQITRKISLPGGYSIIQVDSNNELDGVGESFTIEFCQPEDLPPQELWVNTSWDKDDTDIDTHVVELDSSEEIAYYSRDRSWGSLDIDVTRGFGPENVKSKSGFSSSRGYEVKIHYFSDHGNGSTNTTVRVVYVDPQDGVKACDIIAKRRMENSRDWWTVGMFGPGLVCPE